MLWTDNLLKNAQSSEIIDIAEESTNVMQILNTWPTADDLV